MAVIIDNNKVYFALAPDFMQKRNGKTLLIWSYMPYWIVVEDYILKGLTLFNGKNTINEIIDLMVESTDVSRGKIDFELKKVLQLLLAYKIFSDKPEKLRIKKETIVDKHDSINEITFSLSDETCSKSLVSLDDLKKAVKSVLKYAKTNSIFKIHSASADVDTEKILNIAKAVNFKGVSVVLNLHPDVYNPDFIAEIKKLRLMVDFVLDGHSSQFHDSVQGQGSFDKTINIIKQLVTKKILTSITIHCSEHNIQEIEEFLRLAKNLRINECRLLPLKKVNEYKSFRVADYREIIEQIQIAIKKDADYAKLLGRDLLSNFFQLLTNNEKVHDCGCSRSIVYVSPSGDVYPCYALKQKDLSLGNILEQTFEEIWDNPESASIVRNSCQILDTKQCSKCILRHWCKGGCRAETYYATGTFSNPSLSCKSIQVALIELFWKMAELETVIKPKHKYC